MEAILLYGEDGTQHRAFVHQERIDTSSMGGVGSIPGMKTCRLANGMLLNYVDDQTFENVATGELLSLTPKKSR
jgi:hypothetical protein